jgi:hypothetical protein
VPEHAASLPRRNMHAIMAYLQTIQPVLASAGSAQAFVSSVSMSGAVPDNYEQQHSYAFTIVSHPLALRLIKAA